MITKQMKIFYSRFEKKEETIIFERDDKKGIYAEVYICFYDSCAKIIIDVKEPESYNDRLYRTVCIYFWYKHNANLKIRIQNAFSTDISLYSMTTGDERPERYREFVKEVVYNDFFINSIYNGFFKMKGI